MPTTIHPIQIPPAPPAPHPLPMGGMNPQGREIAVNSRYLTLDGKPWLPVMGEFHFSRYPCDRWEEELRKMKAGGITIVATYLFWIHIEETEGVFEWTGNKDLRHFIQLCDQVGLFVFPRIGPWAHGECRNGGFPDWLLQKCGNDVRKDAPLYMEYTRRFYYQIYQQVRGLLWKDGGPIIGIQIENELLNNAGHIQTLLNLAKEIGFDVPLYTMTGWGPADLPASREIVPIFGGYPDAFWDRQVSEWSRGSRKHYFFSHLRDDNTIGADLNKREDLSDLSYLENYPFGTCEIGGGMQIAYHRRPLITPDDVAAMGLVKIGNGSNLQGFYMYHGGANPVGKNSTMQESQETGYWNDVPVINYDFQAPLGQYGQVRKNYHLLRLQNLFLQAVGPSLSQMPMALPDQAPSSLDDRETLRWAVRSDGKSGFVFINNYQRIERLPDHSSVQLLLHLPDEEILLPAQPVDLRSGVYAIWPINLEMNGALLKYATAQPVCQLTVDGVPTYIFFAQEGISPIFAFDSASAAAIQGSGRQTVDKQTLLVDGLQPGMDCSFQVETPGGQSVRVLILSPEQSPRLWKVPLRGKDHIFLYDGGLYWNDDRIVFQFPLPCKLDFSVYPPVNEFSDPSGRPLFTQEDGLFARYTYEPQVDTDLPNEKSVQVHVIQEAGQAREVPVGPLGVAQAPSDEDLQSAAVWHITVPNSLWSLLGEPLVEEVYLQIHYAGDVARLTVGDRLLDDQFYYGVPWEIGLSRFRDLLLGQPLTLQILPLRKDAPIYLPEEQWPDFGDKPSTAELKAIYLSVLGSVSLQL